MPTMDSILEDVKNHLPPAHQSAVLRNFYRELHSWIQQGRPGRNDYGFRKLHGIEVNLRLWCLTKCISDTRYAQLMSEFRRQIEASYLDEVLPFNTDTVHMLSEMDAFANPARATWVEVYIDVPTLSALERVDPPMVTVPAIPEPPGLIARFTAWLRGQ